MQLPNLQNSVIRRSIIVFALVMPGFVLNYLLMYKARIYFSVEGFGIFYTAISIFNILFSPAVVIGFYYSRRIAKSLAIYGVDFAVSEFKFYFRQYLKWMTTGSFLLCLLLLLVGTFLKVDSYILIIVLVIGNWGNYLAEFVRSGLQGLQRFVWLGIAGLLWLMLRFGFSIIGMVTYGEVRAGVAGVALSGFPICLIFFGLIAKSGLPTNIPAKRVQPVNIRHLFYFMLSFGIFSIAMYADVLSAYIWLDRESLTTYSASSFLPKSIVVIMLPLLQVLFPILVKDRAVSSENTTRNTIKGLLLTLIISVSGFSVLAIGREWFCNSAISIKSCQDDLIIIIASTVVPICVLRVLVLIQLAKGKDRHPMLLLFPICIYALFVFIKRPELNAFVWSYFVFSWVSMVAYSIVCVGMRQLRFGMSWRLSTQYFGVSGKCTQDQLK